MLGQPVTKAFIEAGFEVSLLVRDIEKAKQIFGSSLHLFKGDLKDINSLRDFLCGQNALYLNLSVEQASSKKAFQPEREGINNILATVKDTSVNRIGYLSSLVQFYQGHNGFYWWAFDLKQNALATIKNSGVPYSIFYPSTFMESFDKGAYRQGNNIFLAGTSKHMMYLISGADYGKQVVKAFQLDNGNQEYVVQGQDGYTADEAAIFYVANYPQKKIRIVKVPFALLSFFRKVTNKFQYGAKIIEALNNYPEKFDAEKAWRDLGIPQTKFIDYIKMSNKEIKPSTAK